MFTLKKKKFFLHKKTDKLQPTVEIAGLSILLEIALKDENYEIASIIRDRIERIKNNDATQEGSSSL